MQLKICTWYEKPHNYMILRFSAISPMHNSPTRDYYTPTYTVHVHAHTASDPLWRIYYKGQSHDFQSTWISGNYPPAMHLECAQSRWLSTNNHLREQSAWEASSALTSCLNCLWHMQQFPSPGYRVKDFSRGVGSVIPLLLILAFSWSVCRGAFPYAMSNWFHFAYTRFAYISQCLLYAQTQIHIAALYFCK